MKRLLPVLLAFFCVGASARALVPDIAITKTTTLQYLCTGDKYKSLKVRYLSGHNGQNFALLSPAGKPLLFVQTLAASGAKYQADHFVWWTKGEQGDLYDMMRGQDGAPIASCHTN
ncbi:MliC family protein [Paludibacterium purpuratum]|uniref:Membrane-bound inhibitor of C-type lysozyme n=1 Tax=Paludibacterium purpuratum TaxID=1144873 RepID=A0A4R7AW88_9NEIS|nr:MliC family protein [Paludibacterium purpuratum]TDR71624.1 membrane-bound inhibitor of C-type lysozyme [Paludibacterium purpuratum]